MTRGPDGISLFRREHSDDRPTHTHLPILPIAVHDVTGAGDAVAATLAIALASGIDMTDACGLANFAGRSVVGQFGVGTLSIEHLRAESRQDSIDPRVKIVDLTRASPECTHRARDRRQSRVYQRVLRYSSPGTCAVAAFRPRARRLPHSGPQ